MSFKEAMEELEIDPNASPEEKMMAVCQWELGDPNWWEVFVDWANEAGFEVKERNND